MSGAASDDTVTVAVRVRPLNSDELAAGHTTVVSVDPVTSSVRVQSPGQQRAAGDEPAYKTFIYDHVFGADAQQLDVYNQVARPIVENVLEGYNGTIFAYGQTGTGKTFSMEGVRDVPTLKGLIPNSFAHIFGEIAKADENTKFLVRVSYLEIYNEEVRDLLSRDQRQRLEIHERPDVGVYVRHLSAYVANNADDMERIMTLGNKNLFVGQCLSSLISASSRSHVHIPMLFSTSMGRAYITAAPMLVENNMGVVGATAMNEQSSRSHAVFTTTVERSEPLTHTLSQQQQQQQRVRVGKLHLVDLAGSERQSKSETSGQRLKEAVKINLSLSTLGNVISALADSRSRHVPYRNSKLTRLLQDSLGGNSRTVMLANIGPASYNCDETLNTLRYASRAKAIHNCAHINEDPKDALLRHFQQQIDELKRQLAESEEGVCGSDSAEDSGGVDVVNVEARQENDEHEQQRHQHLQKQVQQRDKLLLKAKRRHERVSRRLSQLQQKIVVGGVNQLQRAAEQQQLLDLSAAELAQRRLNEQQLRAALKLKETEREHMEERYGSLQEEAVTRTRQLRRVWRQLLQAGGELDDCRAEQQRERDQLLEVNRQLSRELKLCQLVIDQTIPDQYQRVIERNTVWSEQAGEWRVQGAAYTGNNMTPAVSTTGPSRGQCTGIDLSHVYLSYSSSGGLTTAAAARPKSARVRHSAAGK